MMIQPFALARILDANLNRAREGLRVIEDWCRLGLNNQVWSEKFKSMRHSLAQWHQDDLKIGRDTLHDPGTELTHPLEEKRENLATLLKANFGRVAEALRVLEEYSKLHNLEMSKDCKGMRYQLYILETEIFGLERHKQLKKSPLYLVTSPTDNLFSIVEAALQGGLTLVQYREKQSDDDLTRLYRAEKLSQLCRQYNALFIVNDRVDIAMAVEADGVHLGQQDIPIALARKILGPTRLIGSSTTNPQEMAKALSEGADYLGVGPVHSTPTKPGKAASGLEYIQYAVSQATVPWFAIGGLDRQTLPPVVEAGAKQVAVVRAIMAAENPKAATESLLAILPSLED